MTETNQAREVEREMIAWAEHQSFVRAVLLTSSRANPKAKVDELSDYDIILVFQDIQPFVDDTRWLADFGQVVVEYWAPNDSTVDAAPEHMTNVTNYADGLKIDFTLWTVALLRRIAKEATLPAELDIGYRVLLDKDHLTDRMQEPTYTAYIPTPPSDETYQTVVINFFNDVPYVAKCLARDDLLPAKWCLDYDMKHNHLLQMLEWRMEQNYRWSKPVGALGKGLKQHLSSDLWFQLESTFAGAGIDENWDALLKTVALFRQVATSVADQMAYVYPVDLDEQVMANVQDIKLRLEP